MSYSSLKDCVFFSFSNVEKMNCFLYCLYLLGVFCSKVAGICVVYSMIENFILESKLDND